MFDRDMLDREQPKGHCSRVSILIEHRGDSLQLPQIILQSIHTRLSFPYFHLIQAVCNSEGPRLWQLLAL